jgi:hypothetical protein
MNGLKVGVRVSVVGDATAYTHAWRTVSKSYTAQYGGAWDRSGKDIARLCYVSYDTGIYVNLQAVRFDVPPLLPPPIPEPCTYANHEQVSSSDPIYDPQPDVDRALHTAVQMIQSASMGARHYSRLKAARLLGGYVGGGLMTEDQAYGALAQALVGHTDDLERALKTVADGLKYGQSHPITLDALTIERDEWIRQHRNTHSRQQWMPPGDPWEGTNTLILKPYAGYRGLRSHVRGKGATRGHSR